MRNFLAVLVVFVSYNLAYSQLSPNPLIMSKENETVSAGLTYQPETPSLDSYIITKNETGLPLSSDVLNQINFNRRYDIDYKWIVDEKIEILIYHFEE